MRPIYETEKNRIEQREVCQKIKSKLNVLSLEMPLLWSYDFQIKNQNYETIWITEIKCRNITNEQFKQPSHYWISKSKIINCLKWSIEFKVPFVLTIGTKTPINGKWKLDNGVYLAKINTKDTLEFSQEMGGRTDRGDPQDLEMGYYIPMSKFRYLWSL